eukprot:CAMPEP_0197027948 /NCGR_PEP_ID=MMETSP1384-20130603/7793_1 /TAXON_ID=29189 /ORGANISM="Ammonia sp." /LENGTH=152 /DNA_ID=CAMNT_0042456877 /DNA_START=105 /DNA_END=563 /DNA_ORIENTATION=+
MSQSPQQNNPNGTNFSQANQQQFAMNNFNANYSQNQYNNTNTNTNHNSNSHPQHQQQYQQQQQQQMNESNNNSSNHTKDVDMDEVFVMMSQLNLGVYAQIASTHSDCDKSTLKNYLTKQLMNDLTKLGYSQKQQQNANIPAVVDLIASYICV